MSQSIEATLSLSTDVRTKMLDVNMASYINSIMLTSSSQDCEYEIYVDKNLADQFALPAQPGLTAQTTGGNLPSSTRVYVRIAPVDVDGREGIPSLSNKSVLTGASTQTNQVTVTIGAISGAVSYNIYVSHRLGGEYFYANVAASPFIITELQPDVPLPQLSIIQLPIAPDIHVWSKKRTNEVVTLASMLGANSRFVAYGTTTGAGGPSLVTILVLFV